MALIVKSEVSNFLKRKGVRTSSDLYGALDKAIQETLSKAVMRARSNRRQTVMGMDL